MDNRFSHTCYFLSPYLLTIYNLISTQMTNKFLLFSLCFRHLEGLLGFTRREFKVLEIEGVEHKMSIISGNNTGENVT